MHTEVSQGSVATRLRWDGILSDQCVIQSLLSMTVKEYWKSVNIFQSYGRESSVLFFYWRVIYCASLISARPIHWTVYLSRWLSKLVCRISFAMHTHTHTHTHVSHLLSAENTKPKHQQHTQGRDNYVSVELFIAQSV